MPPAAASRRGTARRPPCARCSRRSAATVLVDRGQERRRCCTGRRPAGLGPQPVGQQRTRAGAAGLVDRTQVGLQVRGQGSAGRRTGSVSAYSSTKKSNGLMTVRSATRSTVIDSSVHLLGEDDPGQVVAVGVLLPVDEVLAAVDRQRVGLDRGAAVRRRPQPDHVRAEPDRPVEPVRRAVLECHLDCHAGESTEPGAGHRTRNTTVARPKLSPLIVSASAGIGQTAGAPPPTAHRGRCRSSKGPMTRGAAVPRLAKLRRPGHGEKLGPAWRFVWLVLYAPVSAAYQDPLPPPGAHPPARRGHHRGQSRVPRRPVRAWPSWCSTRVGCPACWPRTRSSPCRSWAGPCGRWGTSRCTAGQRRCSRVAGRGGGRPGRRQGDRAAPGGHRHP